MAFRGLSPQLRAKVELEHAIAMAFYGRADEGLAEDLLGLCRVARNDRPELNDKSALTYDVVFLRSLVPELARRLGGDVEGEPIAADIATLSDYELRLRTGYTLQNVTTWASPSQAWQRLTREVCNGNPVLFAMDRICPGRLDDQHDVIVKRIAEVATYRGSAYGGVWTPETLAKEDRPEAPMPTMRERLG